MSLGDALYQSYKNYPDASSSPGFKRRSWPANVEKSSAIKWSVLEVTQGSPGSSGLGWHSTTEEMGGSLKKAWETFWKSLGNVCSNQVIITMWWEPIKQSPGSSGVGWEHWRLEEAHRKHCWLIGWQPEGWDKWWLTHIVAIRSDSLPHWGSTLSKNTDSPIIQTYLFGWIIYKMLFLSCFYVPFKKHNILFSPSIIRYFLMILIFILYLLLKLKCWGWDIL